MLSLLLNSSEQKFYVREIAKLLEKNPSAVKRELDSLEKMGIVQSEKVANLKYFHADESSPLYPELKNLITKSLGLAGNLKSVLRGYDVKRAFIYGPYAEGRDVKTVNIFIVGTEIDEKSVRAAARSFGYRVVLTVMDEDDYKRKKKRRERTLAGILAERRIPLLGRI